MKRMIFVALALNAALLGVIVLQLVANAGDEPAVTRNGDTNGDGARDIGDAIYLLQWLFSGGDEPVEIECPEDLSARVAELELQLAEALGGPPQGEVSFRADVAPVLAQCSVCHSSEPPRVPRLEECTECHLDNPPAGGMDLHGTPEFIHTNLVDVNSTELPAMFRIRRGDPEQSYLWRKVNGTHIEAGGSGSAMPLGTEPLDKEELDLIEAWILNGAPLD